MKNIIAPFRTLKYVFLNLLLFLVFFSLSFSASKHHKISLSTYEFIAVIKSSRVAVFFILNVITIAIFFGSLKPYKDDCTFSIPFSKVDVTNHDYHHHGDYGNDRDIDDHSAYDDDDYHGFDGYDEDDDDDDDDYDYGYDSLSDIEDQDYEDKGSELLMRIEDFIAKNNNMWREESMKERLLFIAASTEILTSSSSYD